jgi:hypothetical protein
MGLYGLLTVSFCKIFIIVRSLKNLNVTRPAYSLILQNIQNCQVPEDLYVTRPAYCFILQNLSLE